MLSDGTNGGLNAGRICWAVGGTFCGGRVQGTVAQKHATCMTCDFYKRVMTEEGCAFVLVNELRSYRAPVR